MTIKLILLACFAGLALAGARLGDSPRDTALKRIAVLAVFALGSLAVVFPDGVTALAQLVGVGRGTDLVLYVLVVLSVLVWLGLYRRLARADEQLTEVARALAIATAERAAPPGRPEDG